MKPETRILHLARQLAEVHLGDHDVLGKIANELLAGVDQIDPTIKDLPSEPEGDFRVIVGSVDE